MYIAPTDAEIVGRKARLDEAQAAHPHRLIPFLGRGMDVASVALNGSDVTGIAAWADPIEGEIGVYPHRPGETLSLLLFPEDAIPPVAADALPRIPNPDVARIEDGLYVCRGRVEVTFRDVPDLAITE